MKEQDQIKAIAELDGREYCQFKLTDPWDGSCDNCGGYAPDEKHNPPNYFHSYDAIIPVIQKQDELVQNNIIGFFTDEEIWFSMTPSQLCEALLRATGKWKE